MKFNIDRIQEKLLWLQERKGEEKASRRNSDVTVGMKNVSLMLV